jgi:solute:Na+ symporter, SSS family
MLTLISFVFFTALVGVITYYIVRGKEHETNDGYFLAGRSLTAGVIAGSLLLTNLSTEQLVGLNGAAFGDGISVMAWEVIAGISLVIMAIFFLPRYLAKGITTIPEFLGGRFDRTTKTITDTIFIVAYTVILLPIILYTGATGLKGILDLHELTGIQNDQVLLWIMVWIVGIIGSIYAIFGGMRTVAVSDTVNGFGLLTGGVMIAWLGLQLVGNGSALSGMETLRASHPDKFISLGGPESSVPWPTLFTGVLLLNMFYWTTNQQIIQRTFAAKSLAEGQKGVLLAAAFKIIAPAILVLPGILAYHVDSQGKLFDETRIAAMDVSARSNVPADITADKLDSYVASQIQAKKKDQAYGALVRQVLPWQFTGFFAAVMVGAILSSFNSALNSTATLFSLGAYKQWIRPNATESETVRSGRWFGTIIAIASMCVAPLLAGQDSIFGYLQKMNGLYFIPIFAVVLMGMLDRRVPSWSANLALVTGFAAIALGYFVFPGAVAAVHEFHFLGIVFVALLMLMEVAAFVSPREIVATEQGVTENVTPPIPMNRWPLAVPTGSILVAFVLGIYYYFAMS